MQIGEVAAQPQGCCWWTVSREVQETERLFGFKFAASAQEAVQEIGFQVSFDVKVEQRLRVGVFVMVTVL